MVENLTYLPQISPSKEGSQSKPFYYVYGYNGTNIDEAKSSANYKTYGVLYNCEAAITACPEGWHLPSDKEWNQLNTIRKLKPPTDGTNQEMAQMKADFPHCLEVAVMAISVLEISAVTVFGGALQKAKVPSSGAAGLAISMLISIMELITRKINTRSVVLGIKGKSTITSDHKKKDGPNHPFLT